MTTSRTDFNHPLYNREFSSKDYFESFIENPEKMHYISLGEALDFISVGVGNFVWYDMNTSKLINFIGKWMRNQKPKIEWEKILLKKGAYTFEEKRREYKYSWNRSNRDYNINLPRINYFKCPRNEDHTETIRDVGGRIRCAHTDKKWLRPSFVEETEWHDPLSNLKMKFFIENKPCDTTPDEWEDDDGNEIDWLDEYNEYLKKKKIYNKERSLLFRDTCYAIIKEPSDIYLPLETILDRLNCTNGDCAIHPFSGFTLASYVKEWWKQPGKKRVWRKKGEVDSYKHFEDFMPWSSGE